MRLGVSASFVGGYACKLVKKPPSELQTECSICLQLLRDPEMVNCCGYKFCKSCIRPVLSRRKPCPLCGERGMSTMADRQLQRTLNGLQVHCSHAENGCNWEGQLGAVERHWNRNYTRDNWLEGCGFVSVECLECGGRCLRKDERGHMQDECPEAQVPCKFNHIGCQEVLLRKHLQSHMQSKMSNHMTLLLNHTQKLADEYNEKSNEIINTIDNLKVEGDDSALSGEVARARKKLGRQRTRTPSVHSAVWGAGGFLMAALLAVLLAVNMTDSPFRDGATDSADDVTNLKQSLQDLEQRFKAMSRLSPSPPLPSHLVSPPPRVSTCLPVFPPLQHLNAHGPPSAEVSTTANDGDEAATLRAELETTMEDVMRARQQEVRDELMKKIADNAKVHDDMLRVQADLERLLKEHEDQTNAREEATERGKDYSTEIDNLKAKLANLVGAVEELAELKTALSGLSSKGDVDRLRLEITGIRDDLVAIKQRVEDLPGLPSLLLEVQRLIREELDSRPPPPPHGRHRRHHHRCHH